MSKINVEGPVFPIPPAFQKNGDIDCNGVVKYVKYLQKAGAKTVMTTAGTSRFGVLSSEEIRLLNDAVLSVKRIPVRIFGDSAADEKSPVLVRYPDRFYNLDTLYNWFTRTADLSAVPIFMHMMPLRDGHNSDPGMYRDWPREIISDVALHPTILGIKEEFRDIKKAAAMTKMVGKINPNFTVIASGGSMARAIKTGARAWLSGIGSLFPKYELKKMNDALAAEEEAFRIAKSMGWQHQGFRERL